MMRGRPPKSTAQKIIDGDTRQRGAGKHDQAVAQAQAWQARRGKPPMPAILRARKTDDAETKARLKTARDYWQYIVPIMEQEKLLAQADQGMLVAAVLAYAGMAEAGRAGQFQAQARLMGEYRQFCDRMGLNESARERLKRPKAIEPGQTQQGRMLAFLKKRQGAA